MEKELAALFALEIVVDEMQGRLKGIKDLEMQKQAATRIETIWAAYKQFQSLYYSAQYWKQKAGMMAYELNEVCKKMEALKTENEKLQKSLEWPA